MNKTKQVGRIKLTRLDGREPGLQIEDTTSSSRETWIQLNQSEAVELAKALAKWFEVEKPYKQRLSNWQKLALRQDESIHRLIKIVKYCPKCYKRWRKNL